MSDQSMMLGVPAGTEPVSERSLEEKPPAEVKPKRKREVRGNITTDIDGESYRVEMREAGLTVRRTGKHHVDTKTMREVVDFVTGQGRLPFVEGAPESNAVVNFADAINTALLECCIEFIAAHTMSLNNPKFRGRYELAAGALREQVNVLAPGRVDEILGGEK